ncbi:hypothetical protein [Epilithonimonas sp. UC225_85]|uniref:hypothetical protein n=1 Tax=Epilithonimonas sp. UC225_85 TaxID=3350167 RepID=UPI0036D41E76
MDTHRKRIIENQKENKNNQDISQPDSEIYDFLDSNLEKESVDSFSLGFSTNIVRKIEAKQQRRFNIKIYGLVSILALINIPLFIGLFNKEFILMLFLVLLQHKFTFAFFIIAFVLIQFGEKLITPKKDT